MNILIINQPLNNRGDESAHKALVRSLICKYPSARITVLWVNANTNSVNQFSVDGDNLNYLNLKGLRGISSISKFALRYGWIELLRIHPTINKILNIYKKNDWIISAPGGICMGGFQDWNHLFFLQLAKMTNKKLIYYGRSFGPFPTTTSDNRRFKELSSQLINYFSFFSVRDKVSENLAKKMKVSYISTVDTAFLETPQTTIPEELRDMLDRKPYVVLVPNSLIWHYSYKNKLNIIDVQNFYIRLFAVLVKHFDGCNVVMLPQTFNYGTYLDDDINFLHDLKQIINDDRIVVLPDTYSSDVQQTIISNAKCMVGARYHSVVFAINNAIPFVALSYEHKIKGLLETLGLLDCMVDISDGLNDENSINEIIEVFRKKLCCVSSRKKEQHLAKQIAYSCFEKLTQLMDNN